MSHEVERAKVVTEALTWLGTPYHHHARVKGAGVDCGMFIAEVLERTGVLPHLEPGAYDTDWHLHRGEEKYLNMVSEHARKVDQPQPGDIAMFRYGRCASHGAIVVQWPEVIHSYYGLGVVFGNAELDSELAQRLVGVWSVWGD